MKRFKSVWPILIIAVLVITLMLGSFSSFAHAAGDYTPAAFFNGKIEKRVELTETFNVPDAVDNDEINVTVKAPDRKIVATNDDGDIGEVQAEQIGNYIITYTKGKNSYSYNVYCYEEKEYFINVKATKDDFIPGYRRSKDSTEGKTDDGVIKLPKFELAYKDEAGEIQPITTAVYDYDVTAGMTTQRNRTGVTGTGKVEKGELELYDLSAGLVKITLKAKVGANSKKWYTQEYSVNVQKNFVNDGTPTISVSNFSPNGNINALYTLPTATAKDSFDNNVFVKVEVTGPDGEPVKYYKADKKTGYADLATEGAALEFDNKNVKSFFLTQQGDYKVTYTAYNGSGTPSSVQPYGIKDVTDKLAPVIKDMDEWKIPNKWGIETVHMGNGADKPAETARPDDSTEFVIPFPVCVDNYSKEDDLTLTINLVNPNNRTVANWTGKLSEYKGDGIPVSDSYRDYFKSEYRPTSNKQLYFKNNTGMSFSFNWIDFKGNTRLTADNERLGDWTLTYSLRDEANMGGSGSARRSYTISVQDNFSDINRPTVSKEKFLADIPKYVMINEGDETFTVPSVTVSDDNATSRIEINYTIKTEIPATEMPTGKITVEDVEYTIVAGRNVKGGETFKVHQYETDDMYYVLISDKDGDVALPLADDEISRLGVYYTAIDNVGNKSTDVPMRGEFQIIYAGNVNAGYVLDTNFASVTTALTTSEALNGGEGYKAGQKNADGKVIPLSLGGFDVSAYAEVDQTKAKVGFTDRDYTGYEISVLDKDGNSQVITAYSYFHKEGKNAEDKDLYTLHVRNIEFTPSAGGEYRLNIRVFDISGNSQAYGFFFNVGGAESGTDVVGNAAKIGSTGNTNVPYELESEYVVNAGDYNNDGVIVRYIDGRAYTLVGNEFTALTIGTYRITDFTFKYEDIETNGIFEDKAALENYKGKHHQKTYKPLAVSNTERPVIEILDEVIPTYHALTQAMKDVKETTYTSGQYIELPIITAYTQYGNADIEVKVSFSSTNVLTREIYNGFDDQGNAIKTFKETSVIPDTDPAAAAGATIEVDNEPTGVWAFPAVKDGIYTITITAKMPKSSADVTTKTVEMRVGKNTLPQFTVSNKQTSAKVGDIFRMSKPVFDASEDWSTVSIKLMDPSGAEVSDSASKVSFSGSTALNNFEDWDTEYKFEKSGNYTVVITATDSVGLTSEERYTITVTAKGKTWTPSVTALTTILIIIGVLLIIGVIIYVIRFKPVKKEKNQ